MKAKLLLIISTILIATICVVGVVLCATTDSKESQMDIVKHLMSDALMGRETMTKGNQLAGAYLYDYFKEAQLSTYHDSYYHDYEHIYFVDDENVELVDNNEHIILENGIDYIIRNKVNIEFENIKIVNGEQFQIEEESCLVVIYHADDIKELYTSENKEIVKAIIIQKDILTKNLMYALNGIPIIEMRSEVISNKIYTDSKMNLYLDYQKKTGQAHNVVGKLVGEESNTAIVISAHFDHVGSTGDQVFNGARDNASGVYALLKLIDLFQDGTNDISRKYDLFFAAFNGEESGLQGSEKLVQDLLNDYDHLVNINIDSIGLGVNSPLLVVSC